MRLWRTDVDSTRSPKTERRDRVSGFTLVELLIVVGIIGIILTIGIPFMNTAIIGNRGINGATKMVQEACADARAMAILRQAPAQLVIRPGDGSFDVTGGEAAQSRMSSPDVAGNEWRMADERPKSSGGGRLEMKHKYPVKLPDGVVIEGLGLNGEDWTEDEEVRVGFKPNGTSDELSIVLYEAETNQRRKVWLEVVTGLPDVESDPQKFLAR